MELAKLPPPPYIRRVMRESSEINVHENFNKGVATSYTLLGRSFT
jgi:hypothetical protein